MIKTFKIKEAVFTWFILSMPLFLFAQTKNEEDLLPQVKELLDQEDSVISSNEISNYISQLTDYIVENPSSTLANGYLLRLESLIANLSDASKRAEIYLESGREYGRKRDYAQAMAAYLEALDAYKSLGDLGKVAEVQRQIGIVFFFIEEYGMSAEILKESLAISIALKDSTEIRYTSWTIGLDYYFMDDHISALQYHAIEKEMALQSKDLAAIAGASGREASAYYGMENYDEAIEKYTEAYTYYLTDGDLGQAGVLQSDIARVQIKAGDAEAAIETLTKYSLRYKVEMSTRSLALTYYQLGDAYKQVGKYELALASFDSARHYNIMDGVAPIRLKETVEQMASVYEILGDFENALKYQKLFYDLNEEIVNDPNRNLVIELNNQYHIKKAQEATDEALAKLEASKDELTSERANRITWALGGAAFAMMIVVLVLVLQRQAFIQNLLVRLKIKN
ncbi:MAG TPA: hypothetical protein DCE41_23675 [Cytophagales bacterium]|nr:hypothetical protein [Cytophagales bacterium]HAA18644.1 hypothetical protein [Cytophagales bacterium]HAP64584.1 hypothetical protein [Cytophagales bacterium]